MKNSRTMILGLGIVILVASYFFIKSSTKSSQPQPNQSQVTSSTKTFDLVVKNNKLVSGPESPQVTQGDKVVINITADASGELHLHGYDKAIEFNKDVPSALSLEASISGRFPYELEDTKTEIGALEVLPK